MAYTIFFFYSRRRHTRLQGDWSSDVCSSDLPTAGQESSVGVHCTMANVRCSDCETSVDPTVAVHVKGQPFCYDCADEALRSEERRVGKSVCTVVGCR